MAIGLQQPTQTQESVDNKAEPPSEEDVSDVKKRRRALVKTF